MNAFVKLIHPVWYIQLVKFTAVKILRQCPSTTPEEEERKNPNKKG
jgi:hypothetical protein